MSAHGNDSVVLTRNDVAQRDALIAEMARSKQQLQHLYDIGRILLRFQSVDETVPAVLALVARSVPLRSAIFILTRGPPLTLEFQAAGGHQHELSEARAHAKQTFEYLVPAGLELEAGGRSTFILPAVPLAISRASAAVERKFVLLPLIVNRRAIFGALQVECATGPEELDLTFVSAVVDQLATALERDAVDRSLRASEAKLAGIMSMAADAVITVDEQMQIVLYNEGAERIFGWTLPEVLGKPVEILLPARFADAHRSHMRDFHASTDTARKMGARLPEIFGRRKSGAEFPAQAAISKLNIGGASLFTVILRDITEQKRIESERAFLAEVSAVLGGSLDNEQTLGNVARLAMRGLADFCVIEFVDERGELRRLEVVSLDPEKASIAVALRDYALDRARPHLSSVILRENKPQIVSHVSEAFLRSVAQDEQHLRLFQAMGLQSIMGVPLTVGGRPLGALIVGSCLVDRRYQLAELELLAEVGQRAALALESARLYRVAQRAIKVRDDVLGVVAHDLRNPLNSIMLQAALFRRRGGQPERRARKPGEVIERAAKRMNRLIQDLLDVTSMEAGHLSIERTRFPVRQVISDLLESQLPMASAHALELRLDETETSLQVWADRERLFQVLENLVGNAAKFTERGGHISVGARAQNGSVLFWVTDTGSGIAASDLPHLFDRFWQVRKAERRGAGLGLAIVKGLVESHAGRVWVESVLGSGTTFFFMLPTPAA
ncbi:MAG: Sensory box histidine kinase [Myxococcaceae bacterium]|nr:Sensory box histidine kinase [Myxococcaceae bacterium]